MRADADMGSFLKLAKQLREEQGGKLKIQRELSHDPDINRKCNILSGLAVLSAVLYVVHMEVNFNREHRYMENQTVGSYLLRYLMSLVTALLLCFLFDYYQLQVLRPNWYSRMLSG